MLNVANSSEQKNFLSVPQAANYLQISQSTLYKHTSAGTIPHYKPTGKLIYFLQDELEQWILRSRIRGNEEIEQMALQHSLQNKRGGGL